MTRVVWANLNPEADARGSWDQGIVEELTAGYEHHVPAHIADWRDNYSLPWNPRNDGAVVVIPGQHNIHPFYVDALVGMIQSLAWALVVITSDEEAAFPIDALPTGPNYEVWTQYHQRDGAARVIPIGLPPDTRETLAKIETERPARTGDVYFAGQNTHERRDELLSVMKDMACDPIKYGNIAWLGTSGFRAGVDKERYLRGLRDARIAPCPSGYHSLDSFRLYEALAAGCIPIVERYTPDGPEGTFWDTMFGTCPIPQVESWHELPELVQTIQKVSADGPTWRDLRDEIRVWWSDYQRDLAADFKSTIARLQS